MAIITTSNISCGVRQLQGLGTPTKDIFKQVAILRGVAAHVVFSDNIRNGNGTRLRDAILANNLGAVAESETVNNPGSGNPIAVWTWTPDYTAIASYLKGKPAKRRLIKAHRG